MAFPLTMILGDVHAPWILWRSADEVVNAVRRLKPKIFVQIGDLYDFYSWGRFPRTSNLITPENEMKQGHKDACLLWERIRKASPRTKRFQLKGNHDDRPLKQILAKAPEFEALLSVNPMFDFDGVETISSSRDELIIKDVCFMHGYRSKLGDHARHNRMKTVCGHSHTGGVVYLREGRKTIWELNAGFIANPHSRPLGYTSQRRFSHWTQGYGVIDDVGPRFVPLVNP